MKILISIFSPPSGTLGSLTRTMAIAKKAIKMGHEVSFMASGSIANVIMEKKFKLYNLTQSTMFGLPGFLSRIIEKNSSRMQIPVKEGKSVGSIWFVFLLTGLLKKKHLKKTVNEQINIIKEYKPDIIITEMDFAVYVSTYILNIPLVTTYAKVSDVGINSLAWKKAKKSLNWLLMSYKTKKVKDPYEMIYNDRVLKIVPNIPDLDGLIPGENTFFTGNLLEPVHEMSNNFRHDNNKRAVFVYLGTGSLPFENIKTVIIETFQQYPNIICYVCSDTINTNYYEKNIYFSSYIPAEIILPFCELVICHAGLNTITQSLEAGVPLLMFPGAIFERRHNAFMVEKNAAGVMGEISDFNLLWLTKQYEARARFQNGVTKLQTELQQQPGLEGTIKKIETWLGHIRECKC